MVLYNFPRSSASIRVRIALAWKGLAYSNVEVDLLGGGQHSADYVARNPQRIVPLLVDGETTIGQSMAILEYLEERFPTPPLLPAEPGERARVRSVAQFVVSEIQPINGLRVGLHLKGLGQTEADIRAWRIHWIEVGFNALEAQIGERWAVGDAFSLADITLFGQIWYTQRNLSLDLAPWPRLAALYARLGEMPAVASAVP